jgi:hypothetical protein
VKDDGTSRQGIDICYVIIGVCTLFIYLFAEKELTAVDQTIVPRGDAFTYSIFLYEILNISRQSFGSAFRHVVESGNFNWLQNFLVLGFSPFLYNQRGSLIFINYFCFFVSTSIVYRTALLSGVSRFWAFVAALLLAAMPWNFHALMQFNLTSLMPEPVFVDALLCSTALFCWFIANPDSKILAAAVGVALGATIWSRGNALMSMPVFLVGFALAILIRFVWPKFRLSVQVVVNLAVAAAICSAMAAVYFYFTYHSIYSYYSNVATSLQFDYQRKLAGSAWILLNMPGLAISGRWFPPVSDGTPYYAVALTVFGHLIAIYSAICGTRKILSDDGGQVIIGALGMIGAISFYLYIIFALVAFGGFYSAAEVRPLHQFEPALVGFICCALSVLFELFSKRRMPQTDSLLLYVGAGVLFCLSSAQITKLSFQSIMDVGEWSVSGFKQLPPADASRCRQFNELNQAHLSSEDVSRISLLIGEDATDAPAYFFWYGTFNAQIARYYAVQNNVAPFSELAMRSDGDGRFWSFAVDPKLMATEDSFREYLDYVFAKAEMIVIPEQVEALTVMWPSPAVAYRKDIAAALNNPDRAPDYSVWAIIDESPVTRVLILKRRNPQGPDGDLEQFPRTWGTPAQVVGRNFKGARTVARKAWWQADARATPQLLYAYRSYNVVRVGRLYVAAAFDLGPLDINEILTRNVSWPPSEKFILARDVSRLKAAIDACTVE